MGYLHIGQNVMLEDKRIIGIFDLDKTTESKITRNFLNTAEEEGVVLTAVEEGKASRSLRTGIRQDQVLAELYDIATAEASDASGAAVKLTSKLRALELLGKHLGMFEGQGSKGNAPVTILEDV